MNINITPKHWKSPDLLRKFFENRLNVANGRFRVVNRIFSIFMKGGQSVTSKVKLFGMILRGRRLF